MSTTSPVIERRWPRSYNSAITVTCPRCGAEPGVLCTTPYSQPRMAKSPCLARLILR